MMLARLAFMKRDQTARVGRLVTRSTTAMFRGLKRKSLPAVVEAANRRTIAAPRGKGNGAGKRPGYKEKMKRAVTTLLLPLALLCAGATAGADPAPDRLTARLEALSAQGNGEAAYHLGMIHHLVLGGVPKDARKALELFRLAAERGDPLGAYKLGCYYHGQGEGLVENDVELALRHKLVAAEAGYSLAQRDVGDIYAQRGDYGRALKWYDSAARQADVVAIALVSNLYDPIFYFDGVEPGRALAFAYNLIGVRMLRSENELVGRQVEEDLRRRTDPAIIARGEPIADAWRPRRTPLTDKTLAGLGSAERLVAATP
jgi:TPR repeat protein